MEKFEDYLQFLPRELQIEVAENHMRKDYSEFEKARIQEKIQKHLSKVVHPGRPKKSVKNLTSNPQRILQTVGEIWGESYGTVRKRLKLAEEVKHGNPRAKALLEEVDSRKRSLDSAYATLGIYERRQKLDEQLTSDARKRNALPTTIKFGDFFKLVEDLEDKSVDSTITSPPFKIKEGDYIQWYGRMLKEIERVTIDYAFIFNSSTMLSDICQHFGNTLATRPLMWYKQITQEPFRYEPIFIHRFHTARFNVVSRIHRDVFPYSPPEPQERIHKDQNPSELYEELIEISGARIILDPFLGSGTTYKVAKKLGKTCIGFEQNEGLRPAIMAPLVIKERK
jgi:hypothetical protein